MTIREILLWLSNKDDTIDYDDVEKQLRLAFIRETSIGTKSSVEWSKLDKKFHAGIYDLIPQEVH